MKWLVAIVLSLSLLVAATAQPVITQSVVPKYIEGRNGTNAQRIPCAYWLTISGLTANATYRYYNQFIIDTDSPTTAGAGNCIFPVQTGFVRTTGPGLSGAGTYGTITASASGTYSGWFITEPTGNATRMIPGKYVFFRIMLNDGNNGTTVSTRLTTTDSLEVVSLDTTSVSDTNGTGLVGLSTAGARNFVLLYDNAAGTGRPISGGYVESDGTDNSTANSYVAFYANQVNTITGAFGVVVPNHLVNGIQRVELRSPTGDILAANTSSNGIWPSTANTVNPHGGTTPVILNGSDVPLSTSGNPPATINSVSRTILNPTPNNSFSVNASISGVTAGATITFSYQLNSSGSYTDVAMTSGDAINWSATVPGQPDGTLIAYHITATNLGSTSSRSPGAGDYLVHVYQNLFDNTSIIVNEIMYSGGGSHTDWVELYNNTNNDVDLSYWQLWDDTQRSYALVPGTTISAHNYLLFAEDTGEFHTDYPSFSGSLYSVPMPYGLGYPSDESRLFDVNGNRIDSVGWSSAAPWPAVVANTGYSIELRNPSLDNSVAVNWQVTGILYGTPGMQNSAGDTVAPILNSASALSEITVMVNFNENLSASSANVATNYALNNGITIDSAVLQSSGTGVLLYLSRNTRLQANQSYMVSTNFIADVAGNVSGFQNTSFTYTPITVPSIIVTEIMYNPHIPADPQGEWFEIYNTTADSINLNSWMLSDNQTTDTIGTNLWIHSNQYMVMAYNADTLVDYGISAQYQYVSGIQLSNTADRVVIHNPSGVLIDSVGYQTTAPWPVSVDGKSISLIDLSADRSLGTSWAYSPVQMTDGDWGSPGLPFTGAIIPSAPTNPTPANNATMVSITPTLSWSAAVNATGYDVYLDSLSSPTTLLANDQTGTSFSITTPLVPGLQYYWKIVAHGIGATTSSSVWTFTVMPAPTAPANPTPANNATMVSTSPMLIWNSSSNATGYDVYFDTTSTFTGAVSVNQTDTTYSPPPLMPGVEYYWEVVAHGTVGNTSSPVWTFTVKPIPSVPVIWITQSGSDVTINWSAVNGATGYKVYRSDTNGNFLTQDSNLVATVGNVLFWLDAGVVGTSAMKYYRVIATN